MSPVLVLAPTTVPCQHNLLSVHTQSVHMLVADFQYAPELLQSLLVVLAVFHDVGRLCSQQFHFLSAHTGYLQWCKQIVKVFHETKLNRKGCEVVDKGIQRKLMKVRACIANIEHMNQHTS